MRSSLSPRASLSACSGSVRAFFQSEIFAEASLISLRSVVCSSCASSPAQSSLSKIEKRRLQPYTPAAGAQHLHAQRVEGGNGWPLGGRELPLLGKTLGHFGRRLVGEGDGGNGPAGEAGINQVRELGGDDAGLARAGTGNDETGTIQMPDGLGLGGVEIGHGNRGKNRNYALHHVITRKIVKCALTQKSLRRCTEEQGGGLLSDESAPPGSRDGESLQRSVSAGAAWGVLRLPV